MFTRLGKSVVAAFTIMRIAGHDGILALQQRYISSTPVAVSGFLERLQLAGEFAVTEPKRLPPAPYPLRWRKRLL
jgi:glutamate/tyrosine decarboxylase-like PLP-dependent enzyme